jgi:hypothetical protein
LDNTKLNILTRSFEQGINEIELFYNEALSTDDACGKLKELHIEHSSFLGTVFMNFAGIRIGRTLRIFGSGNRDIQRSLYSVQSLLGSQNSFFADYLIIADDVFGGYFMLSGQGTSQECLHYLAPDSFTLENFHKNYPRFLSWCMGESFALFYESWSWNNHKLYLKEVQFDDAVSIYPFLWSEECNIETAAKTIVSADEMFAVNMEVVQKVGISVEQ